MTGGPERALDGPYIDLIRDGVTGLDNATGSDYDTPVFNALVKVAMSMCQRGHDFATYHLRLTESVSKLGHQARRSRGRKDRSRAETNALLSKAWTTAEGVVAERPALTSGGRAAFIATVRAHVADAALDVTDSQRAVLAYACDSAEAHDNTLRPVMPLRAVAEATGLSIKTVRLALAALSEADLLPRARRGRSGADPSRWKASLYRLPTSVTLRAHSTSGDKTYVPSHKTYVPSPSVTQSVTGPVVAPATVTVADADAAAARKRQRDRQRQQRHRAHTRGDHRLCIHPPEKSPFIDGTTDRATPTAEEDETVNLADLARANAEIAALKDEIRAEILAELLSDRQLAPVRHLHPVPAPEPATAQGQQ
ncbi:replication/maintenance protein RepL [Blastococcus sp. SYSU DS0669]